MRGIIGVTNEITKIEVEKSGKKSMSNITISNGINAEDIKFTKFKKFDGKILNIIFVASYFYPWHGLNIILNNLKKYKGNVKIKLHLVGDISKEDTILIEDINYSDDINVKILKHEKKYGKDLDNIFAISTIAISTIAISTIAISTKKMEEACPLKTREYIARGIPFIYGYKDVDLMGNENFALKIKEFNIDDVIRFAEEVSKDIYLSEKMRNFAYQKLDWKIKIRQMYDFVKNIDKGTL